MLLPFKKGAFHLAVQAQVPIVPIVVANYSEVLDTRRRVFRSGRIPVKVLKPVETKGLGKEDVDALVERVRSAMLEELVVLTQKARKEGVALSESDARGMMGKTKSTGRRIDTVYALRIIPMYKFYMARFKLLWVLP
ncbi:hypothetical protein LTR28_013862 [Elasticomyces elasticus]|nr:hypothetical protein LTR28_013862 [Elasticomyces elasticus]